LIFQKTCQKKKNQNAVESRRVVDRSERDAATFRRYNPNIRFFRFNRR